ncbi:class IV adenylate cyclase [bacterium]|nr:class IV adenylate cyclase [bacterium]NCT20939.1 class IV adenylate cyclase [bacterium]
MPLEIESKFYVHNLPAIEARLKTLGAVCRVPRQLETNLRFDDAQNRLQTERNVLRLRRYDEARLTFKSGKTSANGVATRQEIEVSVSDFEQTRALLEGLGFRVFFTYEKYRAMYELEAASITLDELPFGNFVEIEAETPAEIARLAQRLGLNPAAASAESYHGLFQHLKSARGLTARDLTFDTFSHQIFAPSDMKVTLAD